MREIEVKGKGVTDKIVSIRQLKLLKEFKTNGEVIVYLRRLGFVSYGRRVNINGTNHTLWFRGIPESKVKKQFKKEMEK